jgi:formamidopyrimidine-DNA glycosylase
MPELPEAETVARQLRERLAGTVIEKCWIGRRDIVRTGYGSRDWYIGSRLITAMRLGKCVVVETQRFGERRYLVFELGMTGLLFFTLFNESYRKHTHLTLTLTGPVPALHYWNPRRFGRVHMLDDVGLQRFAAHRCGCDPLTMTWEEFRALIHGRGRIKALLMHQQKITGIGNIYANEILFRARVHPYRHAASLRSSTVRRLYDTIREVLQQAIEDGGSSVRDFLAPDGTKGAYTRRHLVYNKTGQPCPACERKIRRLQAERSSFICASCQSR